MVDLNNGKEPAVKNTPKSAPKSDLPLLSKVGKRGTIVSLLLAVAAFADVLAVESAGKHVLGAEKAIVLSCLMGAPIASFPGISAWAFADTTKKYLQESWWIWENWIVGFWTVMTACIGYFFIRGLGYWFLPMYILSITFGLVCIVGMYYAKDRITKS